MKLKVAGRNAGTRGVSLSEDSLLGSLCAGDADPCWPRAKTLCGCCPDRDTNLGVPTAPGKAAVSVGPQPRNRVMEAVGLDQGGGGEDGAAWASEPHRPPNSVTLLVALALPNSQMLLTPQLQVFQKSRKKKCKEGQLWCKWL